MASTTYDQVRSAAVSSVNSVASNVLLVAERRGRCGVSVYNSSTAILYIKLGSAASTSDYSVAVAASGYYETPFGYTGSIYGIWASSNGSAKVTEIY